MTRNKFIILILAIFGLSFSWSQVAGAESLGLGIQIPDATDGQGRDYYEMVLAPGESQRETVIINNNSDESYYVQTVGLDVLEGGQGSYLFVDNASLNEDAGDWLTTDQRIWSLGAGRSLKADFTVRVPKTATPGVHYAGLAVSKYEPSRRDEMKLISRVGVIIRIIVPGGITRDLDFKLLEHNFYNEKGSAEFIYELTNQSDIPLQPALKVAIDNFGWPIRRESVVLAEILAVGETKTFVFTLANPGDSFGLYRVDFDFILPETKTANINKNLIILPETTERFIYHFSVFSFWYYLLLNFFIIALWLLVRFLQYTYLIHLWRRHFIVHQSKKSESIVAVSRRYGVPEATLVRLNNLKKIGRGQLKKSIKIPLGEWAPAEWAEIVRKYKIPNFWTFAFLKTKFSRPKRLIKI